MSDINHEFRTLDNRGESTRFEYPIETVRGEKGEPGAAATITVGKTTTGEAGTPASVVNSGNATDAVLDFTIPKGDKGEKGDTPTVGAVVAQSGEPGTEPVVQIEENENTLNFTFTIPRGEKGEKGDPLKVGEVTTVTLAPTQPANVEVEEAGEGEVNITFGVPKGEPGATGETGAPGLPAQIEVEAVEGIDAAARVELVDPETNTYKLSITLPKGEKGDTPETPTAEFESIEWTDDPEKASVGIEYDKDQNRYLLHGVLPHWRGEKGADGVSVTFAGAYDTLEDTPKNPEYNSLVSIGTDVQDLYIYDGKQWQKIGRLTGAQGVQGEKGEKGDPGAKGDPGTSVKFIGYFDGVADIVTKVPEPEENNMAVVTKDGAQYLALYTGVDWVDLAKISGENGDEEHTDYNLVAKIAKKESNKTKNSLITFYKVTVPIIEDKWYDGAKLEYFFPDGSFTEVEGNRNWTYNGASMEIDLSKSLTNYNIVGAVLMGGSIVAEDDKKILLPSSFNAIKLIAGKQEKDLSPKLYISFNPTDIKTELLTWGDLKDLEFFVLVIHETTDEYVKKEYEYVPNAILGE